MDDTTQGTLSDEDIKTVLPVGSAVTKVETDPDTTDADGTDGDATDGTDGDSSDADGTDGTDADGTDGGHRRHGRRQLRHLVITHIPEPVQASVGRGTDPLLRCSGDPEAFLTDTWRMRAAVYQAAEPHGFTDLLTFDDVDRILTTTSLRTPSFRLVKAGEQIPESSYTRSGRTGSKPVTGMADPARIAELFDGGATIVLQGLHRNWEPVAAFCRALELRLGHACQVNAYITPPGTQGLALHADPHDVFVLQAFGRKHWEVHAAPGEPEREPIQAQVGPGDCIYMPTGTPHAATTGTELSGHLTVGVHVATWRDVLADVWSSVDQDASLDDALPVGWTEDPSGFAEILRSRSGVARIVVGRGGCGGGDRGAHTALPVEPGTRAPRHPGPTAIARPDRRPDRAHQTSGRGMSGATRRRSS